MDTRIVTSAKALILAAGLAVAAESQALSSYDTTFLVSGVLGSNALSASVIGGIGCDRWREMQAQAGVTDGSRWCFDKATTSNVSGDPAIKGIHKILSIDERGSGRVYIILTKFSSSTACANDRSVSSTMCYDIK